MLYHLDLSLLPKFKGELLRTTNSPCGNYETFLKKMFHFFALQW